MTQIKQEDLIESVAKALQFISYYHPKDYLDNLYLAWQMEKSDAAKDAIAQILYNSKLCAQGQRPICQDTGMVVAFVEVGMDIQWEGTLSLEEMINQGVRQAYTHPDNVLRASMVSDPIGKRINTQDNTPAITHVRLVQGHQVDIKLAAKGGGSENKAKFTVLNPSASLLDWVLETVPTMGAGWCPPGMLGIGIGGSAEKAMLMAKASLMEPIDIQQIKHRGANTAIESLRLDIFDQVNALGIGAQGLGGLTTILDVKIHQYPTHAASLPVAMIPNCAATRHIEFSLDGTGAAEFPTPALSDWPEVTWKASNNAKRLNLNHITQADIDHLQAGDTVLLSGKLLTGRDAAHRRLQQLLEEGKPLPQGVDFHHRFIYYVGPVDPVKGEVVGPAGPTTATRMDKYTDMMLDTFGLMGMVGKAERGKDTVASIKKHKAIYLMAVGGAAYLVANAIKSSKIIAFEDLGMEAIREFEVEDMPVTVAVSSSGVSVHETEPAKWRQKIIEIQRQDIKKSHELKSTLPNSD